MNTLTLNSRQTYILLKSLDHTDDGVRNTWLLIKGGLDEEFLVELDELRKILVVAYAGSE